MIDPRSSADVIVVRRVLDSARVATVPGELGGAIARYLDASDAGPEEHAFAVLAQAHRAALAANRDVARCLRRFGAGLEVTAVALELGSCAQRLGDAFAALEDARRPPSAVRMLVRLARRRPIGLGRATCAHAYAHAAMAFSERVAELAALLDDDAP